MLVKSLCFLAKQRLLKGTKACKIEFCEHCVLGKQQRVKFGIAIHNTKGILDYVHSDVWGPAKTPSIGGRHYFVTFVEFFGRVWVYTMKNKDDVLRVFLKWKDEVEKQTGRKIKVLRTDNGGEYRSVPLLEVCQYCGCQSVWRRHLWTKFVVCCLRWIRKKNWVEAVIYATFRQ